MTHVSSGFSPVRILADKIIVTSRLISLLKCECALPFARKTEFNFLI